MSQISDLARKFAMKLPLEDRGGLGFEPPPSRDLDILPPGQTFDVSPGYMANITPKPALHTEHTKKSNEDDINDIIDSIKINVEDMEDFLASGKTDNAQSSINYVIFELEELRGLIVRKSGHSVIASLANRFAMKLGIEPRSYPSQDIDLTPHKDFPSNYEEDQDPHNVSADQMVYLDAETNTSVKFWLNNVRFAMHDLAQRLDFNDLINIPPMIDYAIADLKAIRHSVTEQLHDWNMAAKSATMPYSSRFLAGPDGTIDSNNDPEATINAPGEAPTAPKKTEWEEAQIDYDQGIPKVHLPAMLKEYLKELDHLSQDQLRKEHRRLNGIVQQYKKDGIKSPYLIQKRIEEVEKRIKQHLSRYM